MRVVDQIATELDLDPSQVQSAVTLFDKGNSLHFIARYRRDKTGGLESDQLRQLQQRLRALRHLQEKKDKALKQLQDLGKLSEDLKDAIENSKTLTDIKEIMSPYRTKRKTKASRARDKGFQPIADVILGRSDANLEDELNKFDNIDTVLEESLDIVAEESINHPRCKRVVEDHIKSRSISVRYDPEQDKEGTYKDLIQIDNNKSVKSLSPHQIHALLRAEDEGILSFSFNTKLDNLVDDIKKASPFHPPKEYQGYFDRGLIDGMKRLLKGRAERSVRAELKEKADARAIEVFKQNLFDLLLQPGIEPKVIMGIDPGFASGCKLAVVDINHQLLEIATMYPNPPRSDKKKSSHVMRRLIEAHDVNFIAIGNGTASQETFDFVKFTLEEHSLVHINYAVVPETGASVYSASEIAEKEFPGLSAAERGAISIARRVLDPLSEYVKIDPKALGVGQYQHSVDRKSLEEALEYIFDKAVNETGVNMLTASAPLLEHVAGLNASTAQAIVDSRDAGELRTREDLLQVHGIGWVIYEQAAGFLRVYQSENPLDWTLIHPDHYSIATSMIEETGKNLFTWKNLNPNQRSKLLDKVDLSKFESKDAGHNILNDIRDELISYGLDPRGVKEFVDRSKQPKSIEELKEGLILSGEVNNVLDFGAFVNLGMKHNGLIHISNMADRYISNVHSVVSVGDVVKVEVLNVDLQRNRIGLRLIEVNGEIP